MPRDELVLHAQQLYNEFPAEDIPDLVEQWQADLLLEEGEDDDTNSDRRDLRDINSVSRQMEGLVRLCYVLVYVAMLILL